MVLIYKFTYAMFDQHLCNQIQYARFFFAVVFFVQTYDDLFGSKSWKSFTFETDSYALNNNNNKSIGYVYFT